MVRGGRSRVWGGPWEREARVGLGEGPGEVEASGGGDGEWGGAGMQEARGVVSEEGPRGSGGQGGGEWERVQGGQVHC